MKKKNNYEKFIKILNDTKIQYDTMDKSKIDPYGNFVSFKLLKLRDGFSNSVKYYFSDETGEIMENVDCGEVKKENSLDLSKVVSIFDSEESGDMEQLEFHGLIEYVNHVKKYQDLFEYKFLVDCEQYPPDDRGYTTIWRNDDDKRTFKVLKTFSQEISYFIDDPVEQYYSLLCLDESTGEECFLEHSFTRFDEVDKEWLHCSFYALKDSKIF
jgi:hypothetical protein